MSDALFWRQYGLWLKGAVWRGRAEKRKRPLACEALGSAVLSALRQCPLSGLGPGASGGLAGDFFLRLRLAAGSLCGRRGDRPSSDLAHGPSGRDTDAGARAVRRRAGRKPDGSALILAGSDDCDVSALRGRLPVSAPEKDAPLASAWKPSVSGLSSGERADGALRHEGFTFHGGVRSLYRAAALDGGEQGSFLFLLEKDGAVLCQRIFPVCPAQ